MARNAYGFETAPPTLDPTVTVSPLPSPFAAGFDGDPSTTLPPDAARRFRLLRDAVADADAIQHGFAARLIDLTEAGQKARRRLAEIRGQFGVNADHPEVIAMTAAATNSAEELERLNARIASHNVIAGPRRQLLKRITAWLRSTVAGNDIVDIELVDPPKLLKNENEEAAVKRLRRRLRELSADEHRINSAPFPSSYTKALAANHIAELSAAAASRMSVSSLVEHGGRPFVIDGQAEPPVMWPVTEVRSEVATVAGEGAAIGYIPDIIGILALLFKDQMLASIGEAIDAESEDAVALTWEQRREQLAVIASDREAIEQDESHLIWQALAASDTIIKPRADMSPAAFLMVATVAAGKRPAGRELTDSIATLRRATEAGVISLPGAGS